MSNPFYTVSGNPGFGAPLTSAAIRAEFTAISAGFDKLPTTLTANKAVVVNSGGTALTITTGSLVLGGDFTVSGASALTLTTSGATNVTLPTSGTLLASGGALGTPSSGTLTNCTGLPAAGVLAGALASGMTATTQTAGDNSTKVATTAYVATAVTLRGYLAGLGMSRPSTTTLTVAAGTAADSTNAALITLASAMTKSTAGTWASGNNSNGMGTGLTIANTTWYHVFEIINAGAADVYFDTSVSAANKPASTTAFRRVGSFLTNGSAQIIDFVQYGDKFLWLAPVRDVTAASAGTSAVTRTLTVPTGIVVEPILDVGLITTATGSGVIVYISSLTQTDGAADGTNCTLQIVANTGGSVTQQLNAQVYGVFTNTSAQIRSRQDTGGAGTTLTISSMGWVDTRGKID